MPWTRTYRGEEPQRINKWLAQAGVCSRREAEALIAEGRIRIDGETVSDAGRKILPGQTLTLENEGPAPFSLVLHKPMGIVSAQPEAGQIPAARLAVPANQYDAGPAPGPRTLLAPLGRLDQDSRGLLILSEDGVLAKAIIGPASNLEKEYIVRVSGLVTHSRLALLRHGLQLDGRDLKPAKVTVQAAGELRFILTEGRNRQIRRMCAAVGLEVNDLLRIRIGALNLGDLPEGKWRHLQPGERAALVGSA
jgi:23S rRNA pseudouridine2604 synthase